MYSMTFLRQPQQQVTKTTGRVWENQELHTVDQVWVHIRNLKVYKSTRLLDEGTKSITFISEKSWLSGECLTDSSHYSWL